MCAVIHNSRKQLTEKEQKMVKVEHNLKFVTEVDETHPVGMSLMGLSESMRIEMLEGMLKELLAPRIQPALDEINDFGTYAILKVAD